MKSAVVVPTLNAGDDWAEWIAALNKQSLTVDMVFVIDSSSSDETRELAIDAGFDVIKILRQDFNHGATRQTAVDQLNEYDAVIFLTQDAVLSDEDSIKSSSSIGPAVPFSSRNKVKSSRFNVGGTVSMKFNSKLSIAIQLLESVSVRL